MHPHPAIQVDHLRFRYDKATDDVLDDISFSVEPREKLGVLGPNGGGKSTLLKLLLGLLPVSRGQILIFGKPPQYARREGLIGYLPQKIEAELSAPLSVRQVIAMPIKVAGQPTPEDDQHLRSMLDLFELSSLADKPICALSGGQLQRVMIARALARRPKILILDEPTVGIDIRGQQQFASLLNSLHESLNLTLVIVSHELRTIVTGSTRIACLARTMHFHGSASGLTTSILEQVFRHDVSGIIPADDSTPPDHNCGGCCADH